MTKDQIEFLQSLDPTGCDGTIQSVLMCDNLQIMNFTTVLMHIIKQLKNEKDSLIKDNIRLSNILYVKGETYE